MFSGKFSKTSWRKKPAFLNRGLFDFNGNVKAVWRFRRGADVPVRNCVDAPVPNVSHGVKKQTELLIPVQLFILHENEKIAGDIIINEQISHRSEC